MLVESLESEVATGIVATFMSVAESEAGEGEADAEGAVEDADEERAMMSEDTMEGPDVGAVVSVSVGKAAAPPSEMSILGSRASLRRVAVSSTVVVV